MNEKLALALAPGRIQAAPGEQAEATVTVRNQSEDVEHYRLTVEGLPDGWAAVKPEQVSAFGLQETQARIVVQPPAGAAGAAYRLVVRAASQLHPEVGAAASLEIDVPLPAGRPIEVAKAPLTVPEKRRSSQAVELAAAVDRDAKLPPGMLRWRVSVRNAGRTLEAFGFCARGIRAGWLSAEPAQLTLKPGEQGQTMLTLGLDPGEPTGARDWTLLCYLHANPDEGTETQMSGDASAGPSTLTLATNGAVRAVSAGGAQIEMRADRGRLACAAGERDGLALTLVNRSGARLPLELAVEGPPQGWVVVSPAGATLAMGDTFDASMRVSLPASAPAGLYPLTIRARERAEPGVSVRLNVLLDVSAASRAMVSPLVLAVEPHELRISPGARGEFAVTLQNLSTTVDQVTLGLDGVDADWVEAVPPVVPVFAQGQKVPARLVVQPPRDGARATAGKRTASVMAISQEHTGLVVREPVQIEIPFEGDYALQLSPQHTRSPLEADYALEVLNHGNAPLTLRFTGQSSETRLEFKFDPLSLTVPAGSSARAALTARSKLTPAERVTNPFTVTVQGEYHMPGAVDAVAPARSVNGTYEERPPAPEPPPKLPESAVLQLALEPPQVSDPAAARFTVRVKNLTPQPVGVRLTAGADAQAVDARLEPPQLNLAPMAAAVATLSVRARARLAGTEPPKAHRIRVAAQVNGSQAVAAADAQFLQTVAAAGQGHRAVLLAGGVIAAIVFGTLCLGILCSLGARPAAPQDTIEVIGVQPQAPLRRTEPAEVVVRYRYDLVSAGTAGVRIDFVVFDDAQCTHERSAETAATQPVDRQAHENKVIAVWNRSRNAPPGGALSVRASMLAAQNLNRALCFRIEP